MQKESLALVFPRPDALKIDGLKKEFIYLSKYTLWVIGHMHI
jgi:hypothetical protein